MKNKMFLNLMCGFLGVCLITTGCSSGNFNNKKITKIDSDIDYFEINGKKIYLTKNFEQFVLQLKGLGCNMSAEYTNLNGKLEIDDINSKDNLFYSIESKTNGQMVDIECPGDESYNSIDLTLFLEMMEEDDGTRGDVGLYVDRPIRQWKIFASNKNAVVGGKKGRLIIGIEPEFSDLKDIENILGKDFEFEKDNKDRIDDIKYNNENKTYSYNLLLSYTSNFEQEGQHIFSFSVEDNEYWR